MASIRVRDVEFGYELSGSGPAFVWGHGLSSSRAREDDNDLLDWLQIGANARLLRYDARGHGESSLTAELQHYSWGSLAEDQLALTEAVGLNRYVAGGASMGCGTALHAAVLAPERISALVLVIPPTAWETRQERVAIWEQVAGLIETAGVDGFLANMAEMPVPDPLVGRDAWFASSERAAHRSGAQRLATVFRGAGFADLPQRSDIATLSQPTLILAWTGDPGHPVSTAQALDALLPNAELHLAATWDQVQTWTGKILSFLGQEGLR